MIQVACTCAIWSTENENMRKGVQILKRLKINTDQWIFKKCIAEEVLFDLMTISIWLWTKAENICHIWQWLGMIGLIAFRLQETKLKINIQRRT